MPAAASLREILLAQIEHHRSEIFYNIDPMGYEPEFPSTLPGCVKATFAWRAAPSSSIDLSSYGALLCNFPSILNGYRERGWRAEYFAPAHDPEMDAYAANEDRPIDILFVGGYSRHHRRRAEILESVADLSGTWAVRYCLEASRLTRLAEGICGFLPPLRRLRRPPIIRSISCHPVFGRDLYEKISQAKIVLNGAVDMAGNDRGNMRCFEALGCGAALLSDEGDYPKGWKDDVTMRTYKDGSDSRQQAERMLADSKTLKRIARQGYQMVSVEYSKSRQWADFKSLVARF